MELQIHVEETVPHEIRLGKEGVHMTTWQGNKVQEQNV